MSEEDFSYNLHPKPESIPNQVNILTTYNAFAEEEHTHQALRSNVAQRESILEVQDENIEEKPLVIVQEEIKEQVNENNNYKEETIPVLEQVIDPLENMKSDNFTFSKE